MGFSGGRLRGDELHAHDLGLLCQVVQDPLAVAFLKVILAPVGIFLAFGKHGIDQARELVCSGGDGFESVHACAHAPVVRAQGRLA